MRIFATIIVTISFLILVVPVCAYYKWYDNKGYVHYTQDNPPEDAKNEDGTSWWETVDDKEKENQYRKFIIKPATTKLNNGNKPERNKSFKTYSTDENISLKPEKEEQEKNDDEGIFKRLFKLFSNDEEDENCMVPWLAEKHGICPLGEEEPNMDEIGNNFKAVVIDNRKCVWSDCRGTYKGDVITFIYKGEGYWETDGNVPECSFYRGFYWN